MQEPMASKKKQDPGAQPIELGEPGKPSLARALTPRILLDSTPAEWLFRLRPERRHLILLGVLAAAVFFPWLGAVGFWDPWEVHYGEVARSMIQREDYLHPFWENAYFFSKPILSLWMMAVGLLVTGANEAGRGMGIYAEWGVRSVFALVAMLGSLMVYLAVGRTISRRAGVWAAVVMVTSPLYFLLARQAMVDMPFVAMNTAAVACLMIAVFQKERVQDGWLYGFYAFAGLATLAKGLLGVAIPGATMLAYLVVTGDWRLLARLRLLTGALVTLVVAGPWFGTMIAFSGVDDESKTFFTRFFIHDHFKRLGFDPTRGQFIKGVHTTTPNATFVYYLEQMGFGLFPWVMALPGTLANVLQPARRWTQTRADRARLFVVCWAVVTLAVFAFAATKFHHYWFPALPPVAILIGLWIDRVLDEGVGAHAVSLIVGGLLFALVAQNLALDPSHLVNLFVYKYDRPYPVREVNPRAVLVGLSLAATAVALIGVPMLRRLFSRQAAETPSDRLYVVGALAVLAVSLAVYVSSYHWRKLTPHWTQRDIFWVYHQQSTPSEPIAAYQMNWRGETFYSKNRVRQIREAADIRSFVAHPGREWIIIEHSRLAGLKSTLGSRYTVRTIDKSSNKFALVVVE